MTIHVNPLRIAVLFDGEQKDIRGMAQDAVGQLAETAKGLFGRDILVKGAQTMDARGGVVNWSNWVTTTEFDQNSSLRLAHCYRSDNIIIGALHPLAQENEILLSVDPLAFPPRFLAQKIDAILVATGRNKDGISQEFRDMFQLNGLLNGLESPRGKNPVSPNPASFKPHLNHRGLVEQGTPVYSLATMLGVDGIIQDKLSTPTKGLSVHGKPGEVKELVDAMVTTLADPAGAQKRLAGNRFGKLLLEHAK